MTTMATLSRHSSHPTVGSITKVKVGLCAMDKKVSLSTLHVLFCSHGARPPAAVGCVLLTDEEQVDVEGESDSRGDDRLQGHETHRKLFGSEQVSLGDVAHEDPGPDDREQ